MSWYDSLPSFDVGPEQHQNPDAYQPYEDPFADPFGDPFGQAYTDPYGGKSGYEQQMNQFVQDPFGSKLQGTPFDRNYQGPYGGNMGDPPGTHKPQYF